MTVANKMKKTVSVTVSPELYEQARKANLNFSLVLSNALLAELKKLETLKWKADNQDGFQELNRISEEYGIFSEEYKQL
ncbi:type II toxin-antitoxin system CcdA family antitoxin [Providencia zhijiangensis]|uniref:Type II toxin-antitoxin system CcdA family antitoxin n=1 Tax=Providencia zhijiangensis TaxID=3053982 RepID=A0ABZ0N4P1_9GAMM|nr:type II toxin-antitoxin system CcdA family antitoxin [Providencia sp. D4759]WPA93353.1 type II toxin-antitoxin system CcdA family antitoxin [Providencia sp. D4759]